MTKTYAAKSSATRAARKALAADPEAIGFNVATALGGGWTFGLQYEPATISDPEAAEEITLTDEEPGAELDMTDPNSAFKVMMEENDYRAPRNLCKALRATAVEWTGSHKEFKAAAEALGLNPANASAEYYAGRKAAK